MISTASMGAALVFAQRAIWFRLLPMRAICRVRSRSTSAAAAVQVRGARHGLPQQVGERDAGRLGLGAPGGELGLRHPQVELPGAAISHRRTGKGVRGREPPPVWPCRDA